MGLLRTALLHGWVTMRVALVSLNARVGDAIGRQLVEKVAALKERGLTVHVVVGDDRQTHPSLRPFVVRWRQGDRDSWQILANADLIIVEYTQFHPLVEQLPILADGRRKFVFDYHGLTPPELALPAQRGDLHRGQDWLGLAQMADVVVAHSRFATDELREWVDVCTTNLQRLNYPIPATNSEIAAKSLRQHLQLADERILLFVGRAAPNKRLPVLIQALAELRNENPSFQAVIVGPSGGAYEPERLKCRELAADLSIANRVHWLGEVDEATLRSCYQSADVFVMPSRHEGFCLPVIEAMASGLPVIAARAAALPETVADAGLLFEPDDPCDLARQIRRLFGTNANKSSPQRIAVVTPRFGDTTGGAERSLTLIAKQLHQAGRKVTVFTTQIDNADTTPFPVREFVATPSIGDGWYQTWDAPAPPEKEAGYWQSTLRSDDLIQALAQEQFDAVIVGPYLIGLTRDVVRTCGSRTILVPCLHDEPPVHLPNVAKMLQQVGGVFYHSDAERELAHQQLSLSHPNESVIGTWMNTMTTANAERGRRLVGSRNYFVYCGRLIREKGIVELIEKARRFGNARSDVKFAFVGVGDVVVPNEPWAVNLGRMSDADKRDVLAGAVALITLSVNESLSLVVLEANVLGIPIVVNANCAALAAHVALGGGGMLLRRDADFTRCLDRLLDNPRLAQEMGGRGREYVREHFGSATEFQRRLFRVLDRTTQPMPELLLENGRCRAAEFDRNPWRKSFEQVIDSAIESNREMHPPVIEITAADATIPANELVAVTLTHLGGRPLVPTGPGRTEVVARLRTPDGDVIADEIVIPLRRWLSAGQTQIVAVALPGEIAPGPMVIEAGIRRHNGLDQSEIDWHGPIAQIEIVNTSTHLHMYFQPSQTVAKTLARLRQAEELPTGYVDVTTGWGSRIKKWIKAKLLHNFRTAYVDVVAQQQTRFNRRVVESLEQITDLPSRDEAKLQAELAQTRQQCDDLAERVAQLESAYQRRPSKAQR